MNLAVIGYLCLTYQHGLLACQPKIIPFGAVTVAGVRWEVCYASHSPDFEDGLYLDRSERVEVRRNNSIVWKRSASGSYLKMLRVWYDVRGPTFLLKDHSGAGHGEETLVYGIRNDRWTCLIEHLPYGEIGGPILRDLDEDGEPEWIWDDYDFYGRYGKPPLNLIAYKRTPQGRLRRWRTLPNRYGVRLPRDPRLLF